MEHTCPIKKYFNSNTGYKNMIKNIFECDFILELLMQETYYYNLNLILMFCLETMAFKIQTFATFGHASTWMSRMFYFSLFLHYWCRIYFPDNIIFHLFLQKKMWNINNPGDLFQFAMYGRWVSRPTATLRWQRTSGRTFLNDPGPHISNNFFAVKAMLPRPRLNHHQF